MSLLGAFARRSLEDPKVPLSSASLADWLSPKSLAGVAVSESRAYGLTAYYRGIALLSSTMAGLPLHVYRNGTKARVRQKTVLDSPNPMQTPFEFWQTTYANACGWGNAYAMKQRDGAYIVREVWPVHPSKVELEQVRPTSANPAGKVFHISGEGAFTAEEVFHVPYLSPHGYRGVPPLRMARQVLGVAIAAEETAARFYGSGNLLSGLLRTDQKLTREQAESLQERWRSRMTGQDNAGKVAILDAGANFQPLTVPPADAELLVSRKFGVTEIARLLGIPPHLLGDVEKTSSWGTGVEQQFLGFIQTTLQGWLTLVEQRVTRELLPGGWSSGSWYAEYNIEGLLRGDSAARAAFYKTMREIGVYSINEVRARENLEPLGGDVADALMLPSNFTVVAPDGTMTPLAAAGMPDDAATSGQLEARSAVMQQAPVTQPLYITINQAEQRSEPAVVHVDVAAPEVRMEATPVTVNVEPTPVTVINQVPVPEVTVTNEVQTPDVRVDVAAPDVSVAAPTVNVEAPRVTVEAPAGTSTFKVVRDGAGLITGVVES